MTYMSAGLSKNRQVNSKIEEFKMRSGAESVVALAAHRLWSAYKQSGSGSAGSLDSFRTFSSGIGLNATAATNMPGAHEGTDFMELVELLGDASVAGVVVDSLRVIRQDTSSTTEIYITASVHSGRGGESLAKRDTVQGVFVVEGTTWKGTDFALLANNVNCIMCHARINSTDDYFNHDPNNYGTFDRVRVGTLETLMLRSNADSHIAGTLYVRGKALHKDGTEITNWAGEGTKSYRFDQFGKVESDPMGDPIIEDFVAAAGEPVPMQNLYIDYSDEQENMVDGYMPETFPLPIMDDGGGDPESDDAGNRLVDSSEFNQVADTYEGSLSGGTIYAVDEGDSITDQAGLTAALENGNRDQLETGVVGGVVLTGTIDDPILLNGEVGVEGDIILQGYVKGTGTLLASGNVYIPSEVSATWLNSLESTSRFPASSDSGSPPPSSMMGKGKVSGM